MTDQLRFEIHDALANIGYGWCTAAKAIPMAQSILDNRSQVCVEIGVYGGKSLIPCAMALRAQGSGHIIGIDPWTIEAATEGESDPANKAWWSKLEHIKGAENCARDFIRHYQLESVCSVIPARSEHVAWLFQDGTVDFLHIDGNHTELASVRDVNFWLPKMRSGGFIWFDDINWATCQKALAILDERCVRAQEIIVDTIACRCYRVK